jgi:DNA-binding MarR family transcriptional regulator
MNPPIEEIKYSFASIFDIANKLQIIGDRYLKPSGITTKQWFLTLLIQSEEETPNIRRSAELMGCSHQNAKQIANRLAALGFLEIKVDPDDKRVSKLLLTERCREFWTEREDDDEEFLIQIFSSLNAEELRSLASIIQKLKMALSMQIKEKE